MKKITLYNVDLNGDGLNVASPRGNDPSAFVETRR